MSAQSNQTLKDYRIYFRQGGNAVLRVAGFKANLAREDNSSFTFHTPEGETAAVYAPFKAVAAIVPVEQPQFDSEFRVYLKNGESFFVSANTFIGDTSGPIINFRDQDNKYLADVYVATSEVLAVIPVGDSVPIIGTFPGRSNS